MVEGISVAAARPFCTVAKKEKAAHNNVVPAAERNSEYGDTTEYALRRITGALGCADGAQERQELVTDLRRGLVLYPVAHIVDFEISHETRKTGAEFFKGRIERPQAIRLSSNIKGRLSNRGAFPGARQIEIRFGGAVVI